jgi:hypothetical protein
MKKFNKFWKDKDIIILTSRQFTEREFYNTMMYIGSTLFGLTDEKILEAWLADVRDKSG